MKIRKAQFIRSTLDARDHPEPAYPEFAFVGRSNVGKSSLINTLVNIKNFARVSKQPGKTRTINYFNINDALYLVDLPGYGFAKISRGEQQKWQKAIEGYLLNNPRLKLLFVLIDGKVGPKNSDIQLVEWLQHHGVPYQVIATKMDQVGRSKWHQVEKEIRNQLRLNPASEIILFSSKNRLGRDTLWQVIQAHLRG